MSAYRIGATLTEDNKLTLTDLPFQAGKTVEVIITEHPDLPSDEQRYPLWGTPILYEDPTEPVAEDDLDTR